MSPNFVSNDPLTTTKSQVVPTTKAAPAAEKPTTQKTNDSSDTLEAKRGDGEPSAVPPSQERPTPALPPRRQSRPNVMTYEECRKVAEAARNASTKDSSGNGFADSSKE